MGGKRGTKMGMLKSVPVALGKSGLATGTAPLAITAARLFGLDTGDWSMILLGLRTRGPAAGACLIEQFAFPS